MLHRVDPNKTEPPTPEETEGTLISLTEQGRLDARILREFIDHYEVSRFPDKRTVAVSAILKCGYTIPVVMSAPTVEMYEEEGMVAECQARIGQKLADHLEFIWALSTSSVARMEAEKALLQEAPLS